jgi:hypothetical protein
MKKFQRSMMALAMLGIAACTETPSSGTPSTAEVPEATPAAPVAPRESEPVVAPLESLSKTIATDRVSSQVGEVVDGNLNANGKAGYLLFGPYVPFAAGTYTATIEGRVDEIPSGKKIRMDVVSSKGKAVHGQVEVAGSGDLPAFQVNIPEAVGDLEIRVLVPAGSKVILKSYRIERSS